MKGNTNLMWRQEELPRGTYPHTEKNGSKSSYFQQRVENRILKKKVILMQD